MITVHREITADYEAGTVQEVRQHDGSVIRLRKLEAGYDAADRIGAMTYVQTRYAQGEIVTGLLYLDPEPRDLHGALNTVPLALNQLGERELCPGSAALDRLNESLR